MVHDMSTLICGNPEVAYVVMGSTHCRQLSQTEWEAAGLDDPTPGTILDNGRVLDRDVREEPVVQLAQLID